jgi:hypothetical protein
MEGCLGYVDKPLGSVKYWEILEQLLRLEAPRKGFSSLKLVGWSDRMFRSNPRFQSSWQKVGPTRTGPRYYFFLTLRMDWAGFSEMLVNSLQHYRASQTRIFKIEMFHYGTRLWVEMSGRALGSSVRRFNLEFHVGHAAIRLPADPPHRAEVQPEHVSKQKGFSDQHRSRKREAVRLQAL